VKLTDKRGVDIGQGVLCLRDAFQSRSSSTWMMSNYKHSHSSGGGTSAGSSFHSMIGMADKERKTRLRVQLSHGGKASGTLEMMIRLSRRHVSELQRGSTRTTAKTKTETSGSYKSQGGGGLSSSLSSQPS